MSRLVESLWYSRREGPLARLLRSPLWLLSLLFGAVVRGRARRPARATRVEGRVISVGNLTAGGAGKTPVVIHLARRLLAAGERPCVLSRGYGRERPARSLEVGEGSLARDCGDEPLLIARACPGAKVLVALDRAEAARRAAARGERLFLLDDGFQHRRLARDLDIVVLDASNPFGNGHLLPRGPLREPKESLARAGLLWFSKVDQASADEVALLEAEVRRHSPAPIVKSAYRVADVLDDGGRSLGAAALAGKRVLLAAGLARPSSFRRTLESLGATIVGERLFHDHHRFQPSEIDALRRGAQALGAEAIALTEKDAVRLPGSAAKGPFAIVRVEVEIRDGEDHLRRALEAGRRPL